MEEEPKQQRLLSALELARALGVGYEMVTKLRRGGRIPYMRVGRSFRYDLERILRALEERTREEARP